MTSVISDMTSAQSDLSEPESLRSPTFAAPWQANAFALVRALQDGGVLAPGQWSNALGEEIRRARRHALADSSEAYHACWLAALEQVVTDKALISRAELDRVRLAWHNAARRTPHGSPIVLTPQDLS